MSDEFNIGDVVELKSGGPEMTVSSIDGKICTCIWFDNSNKMKDEFEKDILKKVERGGGGFTVTRA